MTTIDALLIPAGGPTIASHPIVGVETDLAEDMQRAFPTLDLLGVVNKLAELPWFDAEDEGLPPGRMWWTVVNVMDLDGVNQVHIQAESARNGVVVYRPKIHPTEADRLDALRAEDFTTRHDGPDAV